MGKKRSQECSDARRTVCGPFLPSPSSATSLVFSFLHPPIGLLRPCTDCVSLSPSLVPHRSRLAAVAPAPRPRKLETTASSSSGRTPTTTTARSTSARRLSRPIGRACGVWGSTSRRARTSEGGRGRNCCKEAFHWCVCSFQPSPFPPLPHTHSPRSAPSPLASTVFLSLIFFNAPLPFFPAPLVHHRSSTPVVSLSQHHSSHDSIFREGEDALPWLDARVRKRRFRLLPLVSGGVPLTATDRIELLRLLCLFVAKGIEGWSGEAASRSMDFLLARRSKGEQQRGEVTGAGHG